MTHEVESSRRESSRKAYPRSVEWTEIEFVRLFDYWTNYCWCYSFESFFKNTIPRHKPHFVRGQTDRPWIRIYPEELALNLGKKEKKRVGFGFWSTDGLPREKKKKITKKTKKVCVLNYHISLRLKVTDKLWIKKYRESFWKFRVQKFMFYQIRTLEFIFCIDI